MAVGAAGHRGAVTEFEPVAAGAFGVVGAGTPETTLYASITGLVISTDVAAHRTGLDCDDTSITTANPFCLA